MRLRSLMLIVTAALAVILYQAGSTSLRGETTGPAALTGQVSSADEGAMCNGSYRSITRSATGRFPWRNCRWRWEKARKFRPWEGIGLGGAARSR